MVGGGRGAGTFGWGGEGWEGVDGVGWVGVGRREEDRGPSFTKGLGVLGFWCFGVLVFWKGKEKGSLLGRRTGDPPPT